MRADELRRAAPGDERVVLEFRAAVVRQPVAKPEAVCESRALKYPRLVARSSSDR
jgi:hypothetical protein